MSQQKKGTSSADQPHPGSSSHLVTVPNTVSQGQKHLRKEALAASRSLSSCHRAVQPWGSRCGQAVAATWLQVKSLAQVLKAGQPSQLSAAPEAISSAVLRAQAWGTFPLLKQPLCYCAWDFTQADPWLSVHTWLLITVTISIGFLASFSCSFAGNRSIEATAVSSLWRKGCALKAQDDRKARRRNELSWEPTQVDLFKMLRVLLSTKRMRTKSDLKEMYSLLNAAAHTASGHRDLNKLHQTHGGKHHPLLSHANSILWQYALRICSLPWKECLIPHYLWRSDVHEGLGSQTSNAAATTTLCERKQDTEGELATIPTLTLPTCLLQWYQLRLFHWSASKTWNNPLHPDLDLKFTAFVSGLWKALGIYKLPCSSHTFISHAWVRDAALFIPSYFMTQLWKSTWVCTGQSSSDNAAVCSSQGLHGGMDSAAWPQTTAECKGR